MVQANAHDCQQLIKDDFGHVPEQETLEVDCIYDDFAQDFFTFRKQRSACPSLQYLIIGLEERILQPGMRDDFPDPSPARCYRKGRSIGPSGMSRDWPHLMKLSELRATSDQTEVLDQFSNWNDGYS
jgi:hypothetical protein